MSTTAPAVPETLEQKLLLAAQEASQIAEIFSPAVSGAIQAGVAVEPIISGLIHMFAALFKHHASQAAPVVATTVSSTSVATAAH